MVLNKKHIHNVLGINPILLEENKYISIASIQIIKEEQLLYETFLSTIKDFAKEKLNKVVNTISDWKDAAVVFAKILSNESLLKDFLSPLERRVRKLIQKVKGILEKFKLNSLIKRIENFFEKSIELKGWKSLLVLLSLGGILFYIANKLPQDQIKQYLTKYLSENFLSDILNKLTDWKTFIGWLGPIIGGVSILYDFLKDLLNQFSDALKSTSYFATKIIKENNKTMKKTILKQLIKEEIKKTLKEEENKGLETQTALSPLIKQLGDIDVNKFNMTFNLLKQGKDLNNAGNKILADTLISLMKNADDTLLNKFKQAFKKIG